MKLVISFVSFNGIQFCDQKPVQDNTHTIHKICRRQFSVFPHVGPSCEPLEAVPRSWTSPWVPPRRCPSRGPCICTAGCATASPDRQDRACSSSPVPGVAQLRTGAGLVMSTMDFIKPKCRKHNGIWWGLDFELLSHYFWEALSVLDPRLTLSLFWH